MTSTWTNNEDKREFHTWRAWGSRVRKKQLDYIMGPKDIRSTWYLHQVRLRTCDQGRELKTWRCVTGWARWTPVSDAEKEKFRELVLCPRSDRNEAALRDAVEGDGLALLHGRLVGAAAEVKSFHDPVNEHEQVSCA